MIDGTQYLDEDFIPIDKSKAFFKREYIRGAWVTSVINMPEFHDQITTKIDSLNRYNDNFKHIIK